MKFNGSWLYKGQGGNALGQPQVAGVEGACPLTPKVACPPKPWRRRVIPAKARIQGSTRARQIFYILLPTAYLLLPTTSHADGYLADYSSGSSFSSHYSGGGSHYTSGGGLNSRYGGSGYYAGSQGSSWNYGGAHAPTSHQHRAAWEQRKRNQARMASATNWHLPAQNTWATRYTNAWFGSIEPGAGPRSGYTAPCGTYQRAPAACNLTTTRYNPLVHGSR